MQSIRDDSGKEWRLGPSFASGAEGKIYPLVDAPHVIAKIYFKPPSIELTAKIRHLTTFHSRLKSCAAIPVGLAKDSKGTVVGYLMQKVSGKEIHHVFSPQQRVANFPQSDFRFIVQVAWNLAAVLDTIHSHPIVLGDINEKNFLVGDDAKIAVVDCDSWQLNIKGKEYSCGVGVALFTPPELQSKNLASVSRTQNHDRFGLARMIFQLLMMGRSPYGGVPVGLKDISLEDAIRTFSYAYHHSGPFRPPPGAPPVEGLGPNIGQLFEQSFMRGSEAPSARPGPSRWMDALSQLQKTLLPCSTNKRHFWSSHHPSCVWCHLVGVIGFDFFPEGLASHFQGGMDPANLLHAELSRFQATSFVVFVQHPRKVAPQLPAEPSTIIKFFKFLFDTTGNWRASWTANWVKQWRSQLGALQTKIESNQSSQAQLIAIYNTEFKTQTVHYAAILARLRNPAALRMESRAKALTYYQSEALNNYLKRCFVRTASISGIGPARAQDLLDAGVETAFDVSYSSVGRIHGFGPTRTTSVVNWRKKCEQNHRPQQPNPNNQDFLSAERRAYNELLKLLENTANEIKPRVQSALSKYPNDILRLQQEAAGLSNQRDQLMANIEEWVHS